MKHKQHIKRRLANLSDRQVLAILVAVVIVTMVWSAMVNPGRYSAAWLSDWLRNFSANLAGAIATFLLFELIVRDRQKKDYLVGALRSKVEAEARRAHEALGELGWWGDGRLQAADLEIADLRAADLFQANLSGAFLYLANLQKAFLYGAQLQNADLQGAHLQHAYLQTAHLQGAKLQLAHLQGAHLQSTDLSGANLCSADLHMANLREANLRAANLQAANLREANLRGASLTATDFDTHTILPDGTPWTPDTDMTRFTDPDHPDFWRSGDPYSPAYRKRGT